VKEEGRGDCDVNVGVQESKNVCLGYWGFLGELRVKAMDITVLEINIK
jgi:hypothetical protein